MMLRRFAIVLSIVVFGSLALAAAAFAAGGGLGPGKYTFQNTSASAFFGMGKKGGPPAPSWSVSVNQGLNSFKTKGGGGPIVNHSTMVFITEFDASGGGGFGCFIVPDSNFAVARGLQSAALHTTLTADEACPGFGSPVGAGKGGGVPGGNSGLVLPIMVDVTWNATGAVTSSHQSYNLACLDYRLAASSDDQTTNADAAGSISALIGPFSSDFANVDTSDGQLDVHNVPQPACFGY